VSLPAGVDQGYVLCVFWIVLALAFLTAVHEVSDVNVIRGRVRARSFARLVALNEFVNRQIEQQWNRNPSEDVIPDLDALLNLKNRVDRAARLDTLLNRRIVMGEVGRAIPVLQIVLAVGAAGLLFLNFPRNTLWLFGRIAFGVTTAAVLVILLLMIIIGLRLSRGQDF
jgi:hypothetical protein